MRNANTESRLKLAVVVVCFGQAALVGCGSRRAERVYFTFENLTNQQIEKVRISGFDPPISSTLVSDQLGGEGEITVLMRAVRSPIVLPKACMVTLHFPDGTTSEVEVAVENKRSSEFTGTLAFKIRGRDQVKLLVTSD